MEKSTFKDDFNRLARKIFDLRDSRFSFCLDESNHGLPFGALTSKESYREGFRSATIPETAEIIGLAQTDEGVKKLINKSLLLYGLIGNTAALVTSQGVYFQDNPPLNYKLDGDTGEIQEYSIRMQESELEESLIQGLEEGQVMFNHDRSIRFIYHNNFIKKGEQSGEELSKNSLSIALFGGKENAEKIAKFSKDYINDPVLLYPNPNEDVVTLFLPPKKRQEYMKRTPSLKYSAFDERLEISFPFFMINIGKGFGISTNLKKQTTT